MAASPCKRFNILVSIPSVPHCMSCMLCRSRGHQRPRSPSSSGYSSDQHARRDSRRRSSYRHVAPCLLLGHSCSMMLGQMLALTAQGSWLSSGSHATLTSTSLQTPPGSCMWIARPRPFCLWCCRKAESCLSVCLDCSRMVFAPISAHGAAQMFPNSTLAGFLQQIE